MNDVFMLKGVVILKNHPPLASNISETLFDHKHFFS
jgi:hypothetical protein